MQTILKISRNIVLLVIVSHADTSLACGNSNLCNELVQEMAGRSNVLKITSVNMILKPTATADKKLSKYFALSDETYWMKNNAQIKLKNYILLMKFPSRPFSKGRGYCGAAYEEKLLLVTINRSKLTIVDELILQSCLNSVSLYSDNSSSSGADLLQLQADCSYRYRLESDQPDSIRMLSVKNGKFALEIRRDPVN